LAKKKVDLETLLGYSFNEPELMDRVIANRVASGGAARQAKDPGLAVLGEAVICCAVVNHFYSQGMSEAQINEEREARVCRENYARIAEEIGLEGCLMPSTSRSADALRGNALAERFEEIMGAIYLDDVNTGGTGIGACWEVLRKVNMI
jgi:dsRNA-specific ribonuclease